MDYKKYYFFLVVVMCVQGETALAKKRGDRGQDDLLEVASIETGNISSQYADIDLLSAGEVWVKDRMLSQSACTKHLCVCDQLCAKNVSVVGDVSIAGDLTYSMPYKSYINLEAREVYDTGNGNALPFNNVLLDSNGDYNTIDSYYTVPKDGLYAITVNIFFKVNSINSGFLSDPFAIASIYDKQDADNIIGQSMVPIITSLDKHYCSVSTTVFLQEGQEIQAALDIAMERHFWGDLFLVERWVLLSKNTNFSICYLASASEGTDDEPCSICLELCGGNGGTSCPNTSPGLN